MGSTRSVSATVRAHRSRSEVLSAELFRKVEDLLVDSVVVITVKGREIQTGFFVTTDGIVCTCAHGATENAAEGPADLGALWHERSCAVRVIHWRDEEDFLLLAVDGLTETTPPVPLYLGPIEVSSLYH